ncbi:hypothetical protein OROMI_000567 [Orobanche minor]
MDRDQISGFSSDDFSSDDFSTDGFPSDDFSSDDFPSDDFSSCPNISATLLLLFPAPTNTKNTGAGNGNVVYGLLRHILAGFFSLSSYGPEFPCQVWMYKLYVGLLAFFCTNSTDICSINGLEVGQSMVIARAMSIGIVVQIGTPLILNTSKHMLSPSTLHNLCLLFRMYPSSVLVRNAYGYFAGMTMAVAGILSHFRAEAKKAVRNARSKKTRDIGKIKERWRSYFDTLFNGHQEQDIGNLNIPSRPDEKAYDKVPREVLWWAIAKKGVSRKYIDIIKDMYEGASTSMNMMENRLRWFGHVRRRPVDAPVRRLESWGTSNIVKGRGRPKKTWIKLIENDMRIRVVDES